MGHISINSFNETEDYYIVDVKYTTYIDVVASTMEVWIKDENNHLIATNQSYMKKNNFEGMKQYRNTFIINKTEEGVPTRVCMEFHSDKEINVMYSDIIPYLSQ